MHSQPRKSDFGAEYMIPPSRYTQICGRPEEISWMINNNDYLYNVQGIYVEGFLEEFLNASIPLDNGIITDVQSYILDKSSIISIERTKFTDTLGKYIIIIKKYSYQDAYALLDSVCEEIFQCCYPKDEDMKYYLNQYSQTPRLTAASSPRAQ
jgi:hypothetical protein